MSGHSTPLDGRQVPGVVVIGAGPVGLTLAMDLAWRGIPVVVLEQRGAEDPAAPKCNTTSARTMEILRRLGCSEDYRRCGLPPDYPNDVVYSTRFSGGYELARLNLPASGERWIADRFAFDGEWPSAERPHRASQMYLERVLRSHAARSDLIDLRFNHELLDVAQRENLVELTVRQRDAGAIETFAAPFVVGCDGSHSTVRRKIGVRMVGAAPTSANVWAVFLKCPELLARGPQPRAWMSWIIGSKARGMICAINGTDTWLVHCTVPPGMEHDDFDWRQGVRDMLGVDVPFEVIATEKWRLSRAVAEHYRVGNVFLAGDAAHSWPPFAGFGMNSGIEDAVGLGWMLAGALQGWAPAALLDSYDAERKRVGERVSRAAEAMVMAQREIVNHPDHRHNIDRQGDVARESREYIGRRLLAVDSQQFNPVGLNFGICYDQSPIICYDGAVQSEFAVGKYQPSTAPGCRAPHFVLANGTPLYDLLGAGFTLLRTDPAIDVTPLLRSAGQRRIPFLVVDIGHEPKAMALYSHKLLIVRPDQRVAWRADRMPSDPDAVLARVAGDGSRGVAGHMSNGESNVFQ